MLTLVLVAVSGLLGACGPDFSGLHLRIAAGNNGGVYYQLAQPLSSAWAAQLGIERPEVEQTRGSPDNLNRLQSGMADVAFSAADVAADTAATPRTPKLRALARIYDDYLHVVVRADSPIKSMATMRGHKVSIGATDSGVAVIAKKLFAASDLSAPGAVTIWNLGLDDSLRALASGDIDAVIWSGGLPTTSISLENQHTKLKLVDIADVLPKLLELNSVYRSATIPATTYQLTGGPVTTLVVPNYLIVSETMSDDVAEALTRGLFLAQADLVKANPTALAIDVHPAIETAPIALHPGALRYYREIKP
ncbi:MAG: C4-dicarboxylate transporter substrate-binding protein [Amycolatopsis sp.]|jgi:TRAP transporter TAXI family solute receptor|nr:C4-dicarboxylate transporter substrate-binding protein [Amycolatopsis sp.]